LTNLEVQLQKLLQIRRHPGLPCLLIRNVERQVTEQLPYFRRLAAYVADKLVLDDATEDRRRFKALLTAVC
jgi:hypothetical protein